MRDSHSRSDESLLVTQVEWAADRAETSSSRTVSILLGASESTSPDSQQPTHRANRTVATAKSDRSAWQHRFVEASRHAPCRAQAGKRMTPSKGLLRVGFQFLRTIERSSKFAIRLSIFRGHFPTTGNSENSNSGKRGNDVRPVRHRPIRGGQALGSLRCSQVMRYAPAASH